MSNSRLSRIRIVLVEPAGERNVGAIARAMKNMALEQLILVAPRCDFRSSQARQMAVHAGDVLNKARVYPTLTEALSGCQRAVATTARERSLPTALEPPREVLPWLLTEDGESALIFGPEDRGLSNAELNYAQRFAMIPANPDYPSLNLASAATICAYELYQANTRSRPAPVTEEMATVEALEGYYQHLERVLLAIRYLFPHTATARMEKFRRLFNRSQLTREELAMLRGILRQTEWAIGQSSENEK